MHQSALDHAVARATGESIRLIKQRGFSLLVLPFSTLPQEEPAHTNPSSGNVLAVKTNTLAQRFTQPHEEEPCSQE
jgi:hypothetical protein